MNRIKYATLSAITTTAVVGAAAPATADPATPEIHYSAKVIDHSVVLTTDGGTLTADHTQFHILDAAGRPLAGIPLTYQRDGKNWPIAAEITGNTATFTPLTDPSAATPDPTAHDIAIDPQSAVFNTAVSNLSTQAGVGVALGLLIGTAIGAGIGCIAGGLLVGAAAAVPTIGVLAVPGFLGGCLVTAAAAGAIGGVIGTVALGVPVAIASTLLFIDALGRQAMAN